MREIWPRVATSLMLPRLPTPTPKVDFWSHFEPSQVESRARIDATWKSKQVDSSHSEPFESMKKNEKYSLSDLNDTDSWKNGLGAHLLYTDTFISRPRYSSVSIRNSCLFYSLNRAQEMTRPAPSSIRMRRTLCGSLWEIGQEIVGQVKFIDSHLFNW